MRCKWEGKCSGSGKQVRWGTGARASGVLCNPDQRVTDFQVDQWLSRNQRRLQDVISSLDIADLTIGLNARRAMEAGTA